MLKRTKVMIVAMTALLVVATAYGVFLWKNRAADSRQHLLALLPADANAVIFVDLASMRQSPFLNALLSLAPRPAPDADYARFIQETGFDFEKDLDRIAIAFRPKDGRRAILIAADGRFNQEKIEKYALRTASKANRSGRQFYDVPASANNEAFSFVFLTDRQIALTNDGTLASDLAASEEANGSPEWDTRFDRLAGSPMFVLIRQNASAGQVIAQQAPGGFRSPQLASLIDQLAWISIAAKPVAQRLQVVAEGESPSGEITGRLSDFLNGALLLAEGGLTDPKLRARMDGDSRSAYLELLKSVDISRIDRSATKSVRIVFEVTPETLALAKNIGQEQPKSPPPPATTDAAKKAPASKPAN